MADRERRSRIEVVECRADEGTGPRLGGYAAVFGARTMIAGLFEEEIKPGAFTNAIGADDVRAFFNHDPNFPLGRSSAGTLRLDEDTQGLRYEIDMPDTQIGRDVMTSVKRGDVQGSSFSFVAEAEEWRKATKEQPIPLRIITRAKLFDVSPVVFPAYEQTSVSARSQAEHFGQTGVETLTRERSRWALSQRR